MFSENILIVDDNKALCFIMQEELLNNGYSKVDYVHSGEEAIEKLKLAKYDIAFLDIALPGINGIETAMKAKELHPALKTIFISGQVEPHVIMDDLKRSSKGEKVIFLYKPFKKDEISESLNTLLEKKSFVYTML